MRPADSSSGHPKVEEVLPESKHRKHIQHGSHRAAAEDRSAERSTDHKTTLGADCNKNLDLTDGREGSVRRPFYSDKRTTSGIRGKRANGNGKSSSRTRRPPWMSYNEVSIPPTAPTPRRLTSPDPSSAVSNQASRDSISRAQPKSRTVIPPKSTIKEYIRDWTDASEFGQTASCHREYSKHFRDIVEFGQTASRHREYLKHFRDIFKQYSTSLSATERRETHKSLIEIWTSLEMNWPRLALCWEITNRGGTASSEILAESNWSHTKRDWKRLEEVYKRHLQEHEIWESRKDHISAGRVV
jgi:hypothetical protein